MKKFTLMLIAALLAVVSFAGTPVRKTQHVNATKVSVERHNVPQHKALRTLSLPKATSQVQRVKKSLRKVAPRKVASIDDLAGDWMLASAHFELDESNAPIEAEPAMGGRPVKFEKADATTILISGFTADAEQTVTASVDLEEGTLTIADGQTLFETDYGPILLCNAVEEGAPLVATIDEDGTISMSDQLWYTIIGGDGEYAGYQWDDFYYASSFARINGKMTWTYTYTEEAEDDEEEGVLVSEEAPVLIVQDPDTPKEVYVFNFANQETAVVIDMKEGNRFEIASQLIEDGGDTYGKFYTYGLSEDGESTVALTGTGTETALTFECFWSVYAPTTGYWYGLLNPATIAYIDGSKFVFPAIPDVAAMPADPSVEEINEYDPEEGYGSVFMTIPTTDAEGNDLKEDKLFYTLYADVAGEVSQLTFTPDICEKLTENLTEIPYAFTDDWDFQTRESYKVIFLNYDFSNYDRIGVQSIYYGGGVRNATEIQWVEFEKPVPSDETAFFFNEMDVPTSGTNSSDGDITQELTLTAGCVTLVVSPKAEGNNTPNRFWTTGSGPQLRVYSGTLTFTVPEGAEITEMVFDAARWNTGNNASNGEFGAYADNEVTWTGSAQEVTVYIAGNTQINSIVLNVNDGGDTPIVDEDPIVPPADLVTSTYLFKAMTLVEDEEEDDDSEDNLITATLEEYEQQVVVGFDNNDVYIQGLCDYLPEAWIKGTKNEDGQYIVPASQYMGTLDYLGLLTLDFFFTAIDDSDNLIDAVLSIDSETGVITSNQVLAINLAKDELDYYQLFTGVNMTELQEIAAVPVDPVIVSFEPGEEAEDEIYVYIELDIPSKSVNGDELIMSKLAYQFFIEKDGEVQPLTFTTDLYTEIEDDMTIIPYLFSDDWDFYRGGELVYFNQPLEEIQTWTKIGVKTINYAAGETNESNIVWLDLTAYWGGYDDGITGATAAGDVRYFDLTGRAATATQKGILVKQVRHQNGTVSTTKVLRK